MVKSGDTTHRTGTGTGTGYRYRNRCRYHTGTGTGTGSGTGPGAGTGPRRATQWMSDWFQRMEPARSGCGQARSVTTDRDPGERGFDPAPSRPPADG